MVSTDISEQERLRQEYASYTDEELRSQILFEQKLKARGYHPETLDLKKRGYNPAICDVIIAGMEAELARRERSK